jgi:hypothetical protein
MVWYCLPQQQLQIAPFFWRLWPLCEMLATYIGKPQKVTPRCLWHGWNVLAGRSFVQNLWKNGFMSKIMSATASNSCISDDCISYSMFMLEISASNGYHRSLPPIEDPLLFVVWPHAEELPVEYKYILPHDHTHQQTIYMIRGKVVVTIFCSLISYSM